ncbi:hypothetical protein [Burkholderia gladioli]|uniref:Unsaturated glucuronyl hydrolase n=1 Tax=Burkholderia gladioli (strain BSR3) TaxID=999541 RepID=F2LT74_BURGS|nr:hypothetical protein [Burkholderia gladioli]AEA66020.1 unsaturated glucuronyl hydrolase [Burkholderia gladioli BSR3]MBW5285052.1 unsaturated glucuronyl hydrolase [Burkholderia gladioli]
MTPTTLVRAELAQAHAQLDTVIGAACVRLDQTASACGDAFPLYAAAPAHTWTTSAGGSWSGGFWAASWWRRARLTGSRACRDRAAALTARLADKLAADSINRCMVFWYGAALGAQGFGTSREHALARQAARTVAASFDPVLGCVPLGKDMGGGPRGAAGTSVDSLAALIGLLTFDDAPPVCVALARAHADTLVEVCATPDGAWHAHAEYGPCGWSARGEPGVWSRGQAWAMLGLAAAAGRWGGDYVVAAASACRYWLNTRSDSRPPNRLDQPDGPADASAALIAAHAMLALARATAAPSSWQDEAARLIGGLLAGPDYVALDGGAAAFRGACYPVAPDRLALVETPWSSFLLLDAVCELAASLPVPAAIPRNHHS